MAESDSRKDHKSGWLLVIPAIIVAALVLNGLDPASGRAQLFFLDASRTKLVAETRNLALMGSMEERSKQVLDELMLGPFGYKLQPLFKQDARLAAVLHRGNRLYVELDIPDLANLDISFSLIRSAFERTLSASVPGAGVLELDVNGNPAETF
ncbi:MAG: hypothetical protein WC820_09950 [Spirochaetales bacterium]